MKKNTFILMAMTTMFGLSSCDKELFSTENTNKTFTLFATTETGTKTALSGNDTDGYQVVWSEGDQFVIYYKNIGNNNYKKVLFSTEFTLESGEGTPNGTFTGSATLNTDIEYMALYPASIYSDPYNKTTWPATTQTYTAGKITNSPMFATFTVNEKDQIPTVSFKNMGGILRLTITGANTDTIKSITVNAKNPDTSITLDCSNKGNGVALSPDGVQFHIAMPSADGIITADENDEVASYSDVYIQITDKSGKICTKKMKSGELVIKRSMITKASIPVNSSDFKTPSVGEKISFGAHEGIVVDLGGELGKVIVATMNVGAGSVNGEGCLGDKMNYDAACAAWSGWRLPTVNELTAFCDPFYPGVCGDTQGAAGCTGAVMWNIDGVDGIDLYLPLNGNDEYENPSDIYWTGTPGSDGTYYYFAPAIDWEDNYFPLNPDYIRKEEANTANTYRVRLFHDLP